MTAIFNVVKGIGEFIDALWGFVTGLIEDTITMVDMIGGAILKIPQLLGWLPTSVAAVLLVLVGVAVTYKVLGREG